MHRRSRLVSDGARLGLPAYGFLLGAPSDDSGRIRLSRCVSQCQGFYSACAGFPSDLVLLLPITHIFKEENKPSHRLSLIPKRKLISHQILHAKFKLFCEHAHFSPFPLCDSTQNYHHLLPSLPRKDPHSTPLLASIVASLSSVPPSDPLETRPSHHNDLHLLGPHKVLGITVHIFASIISFSPQILIYDRAYSCFIS